MPRKNRPQGQLPRGLGVPPISPKRTPHNHPDGRPISDNDIRAAWHMRIYTFPAQPGYPGGHRLLACRGGGSLLEIVVANYGTGRQTIVHADVLRDKFKQDMDRAIPGWRVTWET